jgi:apolipoprotein N-acyltransferase
VIDPALADALEAGARTDPWAFGGHSLEREHALLWSQLQRNWVDVSLFGSSDGRLEGVLPKGTAFLSGAEYLTAVDGRVRRMNAVFLWEGPGQPEGPVGKLHLVPSGETMMGLERLGFVRDFVMWMAGYVPDLLPDDSPDRTLSFEARDGRRFTLGLSICFDNAFDDPYSKPLRAGPEQGGGADFHLVVSNEAWFKESQEADQMMAFSRLQALATGRAVVRATNSGISAVLAPDGRELARLVVNGRDREVTGVLTEVVPVPSEARITPWVRWGRAWSFLWILGPLALLLAVRKPGGNPPRAGG